MKRRPTIAAVLLAMIVIALALPLCGLWLLRLYENSLIRQTESELITQAAMIAAVYRSAWRAADGDIVSEGRQTEHSWTRRPDKESAWDPRFATLDLATDRIRPTPPDAPPSTKSVTAAAMVAGRTVGTILREAQRTTLAAMRVVDRNGTVVASTNDALNLSLASREEVKRALYGEPVSLLRRRGRVSGNLWSNLNLISRGHNLRVYVTLPMLEENRVLGAVMLSRTPLTVLEALHESRWSLAWLAILLAGSVTLLVTFGTMAIGRPLRAVTEQAKHAARGARGAIRQLSHPKVREIAELSNALVRMSQTLEQRADYIGTLAAHLSHEFKTPLATIHGTVELLEDHIGTMSDGERSRFLQRLDSEAKRLSNLVGRLLDLAHADVLRPGTAPSTNLLPLLERISRSQRFTGMNFDLTGVSAEQNPHFGMDEEALESVLINLIDNSLRYAGPAATIAIANGRDEAGDYIRIADTGPGISAAHAERVFTPFFTTARESGGTGLGLAIVQGLINAHGGTIEIVPSDCGVTFEIRLPVG